MDAQNRRMLQDEYGLEHSGDQQSVVLIDLTTEDDEECMVEDGVAEAPTESVEVIEVPSDTKLGSPILDTTSAPRPSPLPVGVIVDLQDQDILNNHCPERPNGIPADPSKGHEDDSSIKWPSTCLLVHDARDTPKVLEHFTHAPEPIRIGNSKDGTPISARQESTVQYCPSLAAYLPLPTPTKPSHPLAAARYGLASYKIFPSLPKQTQQNIYGPSGHTHPFTEHLLAAPTQEGAPTGATKNNTVHTIRPPMSQVCFRLLVWLVSKYKCDG